jgi:Protein of unknown function (DUF2971)
VAALRQPLLYRIYAVCFCEEENLLSQWRAYGQNGGYSIGFSMDNLHGRLVIHPNIHRIALQKVIYRERPQRRILDCFLADALPVLSDPMIDEKLSKLTPSGISIFRQGFSRVLQTIALNQIVRFKHPAFN